MGHLGPRVSALLDGQLSPLEAEEAWAHVYSCHTCRDLVEREGWVKTRLAGLSSPHRAAPPDLKGSLLSMPPGDRFLVDGAVGPRRTVGVAVVGGGAVGAAMLGVLALGMAPGSAPSDRRPPATQINTTVVTPAAPAPTVRRGATRPAETPTMVPATLRRMLP